MAKSWASKDVPSRGAKQDRILRLIRVGLRLSHYPGWTKSCVTATSVPMPNVGDRHSVPIPARISRPIVAGKAGPSALRKPMGAKFVPVSKAVLSVPSSTGS
jgi:hypothetical protein